MRRESDRGCVFVLDGRILGGPARAFLAELPLRVEFPAPGEEESAGARLVVADTDRCLREALAHMHMLADVRRRGLDLSFFDAPPAPPPPARIRAPAPEILDVAPEDLPF